MSISPNHLRQHLLPRRSVRGALPAEFVLPSPIELTAWVAAKIVARQARQAREEQEREQEKARMQAAMNCIEAISDKVEPALKDLEAKTMKGLLAPRFKLSSSAVLARRQPKLEVTSFPDTPHYEVRAVLPPRDCYSFVDETSKGSQPIKEVVLAKVLHISKDKNGYDSHLSLRVGPPDNGNRQRVIEEVPVTAVQLEEFTAWITASDCIEPLPEETPKPEMHHQVG